MRRAQSTLEYSYVIGILAVAVIAMLVYISRGLQGRMRSVSDQVSAGQYSPGNTVVNNTNIKRSVSSVVSNSTTTTVYGNGQAENPAMLANRAQQQQLKDDIEALQAARLNRTAIQATDESAEARGAINLIDTTGMTLDQINQLIEQKNEDLNTLVDEYGSLAEEWDARTIIPDITTGTSSNVESGTQRIENQTDERLGNFSNDKWH